jgi:hypothetical protein
MSVIPPIQYIYCLEDFQKWYGQLNQNKKNDLDKKLITVIPFYTNFNHYSYTNFNENKKDLHALYTMLLPNYMSSHTCMFTLDTVQMGKIGWKVHSKNNPENFGQIPHKRPDKKCQIL